MKIKWRLLVVLFLSFSLFGCANNHEIIVSKSENPTAKDILDADANADIFQWDGVIYQTEIDWVDELALQEDEQVGVIEFKTSKVTEFKNGVSNQLPLGAKIYSVKEHHDILIIKYDNQIKRYLALLEG